MNVYQITGEGEPRPTATSTSSASSGTAATSSHDASSISGTSSDGATVTTPDVGLGAPSGENYLGCWADDADARVLLHGSTRTATMSVEVGKMEFV